MPSPIRTSRLARRATNSFVDWEDPIFQDPASRLLEPQIIVYEAPVCHAHNAETSSSSNFSACGFTALNYVRLAWKLEIEGITDAELLRRMISQVMVDDMMKIRQELNADTYLDVGESLAVPIFEKTLLLDPAATLSHVPEIDNLKSILSAWFSQTSRSVRTTVLSQSGEVLLCLRIPVMDSTVYALFDCHPRSHHPHAPAFILSKCLDDVIAVASNIFSEGRKYIPLGNADPYHHLSVHCIVPDPYGHLLDVEELLSHSISHLHKRSAETLAFDHLALLQAQAEQRKSQVKSVAGPSHTECQDKSEAMPVPSGSSSPTKSGLNHSQSISARRHSEFGWQLALLRNLEPALSGDPSLSPTQHIHIRQCR
ncbi:hypothetical protein BJ912DRAFT_431852 [Pholiota molesta]|nr:hypothetical protein BJ912DRAFT_431852 [Pholiota molesta]